MASTGQPTDWTPGPDDEITELQCGCRWYPSADGEIMLSLCNNHLMAIVLSCQQAMEPEKEDT